MLGTRSFSGWTRATRMFVALAAGAAVLFAAIAVRGSAAHSTARPQPMVTVTPRLTRLHIGPLSVCTGCGDDSVHLTATNLSGTAREVNITLFDQDGQKIEGLEAMIGPGRSRALQALLLPAVQKVRGRLVSPEGGRWTLGLSLTGGEGNDLLAFTDRATSASRLPDGAASSALVSLTDVIVVIANMGPQTTSFRVQLVDRSGDVVASRRIDDLEPGYIGTVEFDTDIAARAVVRAPEGSKFLPLGGFVGGTQRISFNFGKVPVE